MIDFMIIVTQLIVVTITVTLSHPDSEGQGYALTSKII